MKPTLLQHGAEAKIFLTNNIIEKQRLPKAYRHPTLDNQIRTRRTKHESKILQKAHNLKIQVPKLIHTEKFNIQLEYIKGDRISQTLNSYTEKIALSTMQKIGRQVAKLHKNNIIHADLTTSNIILQKTPSSKVFIIDFGLSYISTKIEDKAVDLQLIKQALEAKHFLMHKKLFTAFKKGYKWQNSKEVIERLSVVEKRGRYKH